jgi:hypothetical protein
LGWLEYSFLRRKPFITSGRYKLAVLLSDVCKGGAIAELRECDNEDRWMDRYRWYSRKLGLLASIVIVEKPADA